MEFHVPDGKLVCFRHIHPHLADQLRSLPDFASNLSDKAEQRIYPSPGASEELEDLRADWRAFVEIDLHDHFMSNRQVVTSDLRTITDTGNGFELTIPEKHIDAWLNVLNQARLAIEADHRIAARDFESGALSDLTPETGIALLRNELFIFMQECLVQHLG